MKLGERLNQMGRWVVTIERGADEEQFECINRPAITFGENMMRIADAEFEVWLPSSNVRRINVEMSDRRSLQETVESLGLDKLRACAKKLKSDSVFEEDFQIGTILTLVADMHEEIRQFVGVADDD